MTCCPHSHSAGRLFSLLARCYRWRFERDGFEPSQRQLLGGIEQAGFKDATILDIGCGVGQVHQHLLEKGAASATGIDLAPKMLAEAQRRSGARGLSARTRYREGDFMELCETLEAADIVVLDKVVCCYPDAEALVSASIAKAKRVYALTYPRDRWYVRLMMNALAVMLKLLRSAFRPYVHDPERIQTWIGAAGFEKSLDSTTSIWQTQVYTRR